MKTILLWCTMMTALCVSCGNHSTLPSPARNTFSAPIRFSCNKDSGHIYWVEDIGGVQVIQYFEDYSVPNGAWQIDEYLIGDFYPQNQSRVITRAQKDSILGNLEGRGAHHIYGGAVRDVPNDCLKYADSWVCGVRELACDDKLKIGKQGDCYEALIRVLSEDTSEIQRTYYLEHVFSCNDSCFRRRLTAGLADRFSWLKHFESPMLKRDILLHLQLIDPRGVETVSVDLFHRPLAEK